MSDFNCKAILVEQPSAKFYVAAVKAADLRTICRPLMQRTDKGEFLRGNISSVALSDEQLNALVKSLQAPSFRGRGADVISKETAEPYQRLLNEGRARDIARYIEQPSALMPNSIILAINTMFEDDAVIKPLEERFVNLTLPRSPESAVILDGQHRVAAFDFVNSDILETMEVVVTFLFGVPFYQQAEIFAIINGQQKPVNRSIIYDLFGYITPHAKQDGKLYEGLMAVSRFCSHTARILNNVGESPWKNMIKMRGPGDAGVISQASVVDYMAALVEPKQYSPRLKALPLLYCYFKDDDSITCASVLIVYLSAVQMAWKNEWADKRTLFWKNNGVALMFRILHDLMLLAGGASQLMDQYQSIVRRWRRAPSELILTPPKTGGGGVQNQLYEFFKMKMFDAAEQTALMEKREDLKRLLLTNGGLIL